MAIPDYQDLMLPLLRATADGAVYTLKELDAVLTRQFSLTQEDLDARFRAERSASSSTDSTGRPPISRRLGCFTVRHGHKYGLPPRGN